MEGTFLSEVHSEKMLGFKEEQQGLQTQYGLKSQQNLNRSETHPTLCIHFSKTVRIIFFCSFFVSCSWQLFDTVNNHGGYWKPSATNNLQC